MTSKRNIIMLACVFLFFTCTPHYSVVEPTRRDSLRRYLLKNGFDSKITDMSDCSLLKQFDDDSTEENRSGPRAASILEICVYPVVSENSIRRLAHTIQSWVHHS